MLIGYEFQFHDGTIKTFPFIVSFTICTLFQFHDGTIKTRFTLLPQRAHRLFQFHDGTIKTQDEDGNQRDNMISIP